MLGTRETLKSKLEIYQRIYDRNGGRVVDLTVVPSPKCFSWKMGKIESETPPHGLLDSTSKLFLVPELRILGVLQHRAGHQSYATAG